MLHIIFLILKIIGIVLAVLVGIILLLLLITLLVPIRYQLLGKKEGDSLFLDTRATWLLRLVIVSLSYIDEKLWIRLRVLGHVFYDNQASVEDAVYENERAHDRSDRKSDKDFDRYDNDSEVFKNKVNNGGNTKNDDDKDKGIVLKEKVSDDETFVRTDEQKDDETLVKMDEQKENEVLIKVDEQKDDEVLIKMDEQKDCEALKEFDEDYKGAEKTTDYEKDKNIWNEDDLLDHSMINGEIPDETDKEKRRKRFSFKKILFKIKALYHKVGIFFQQLREKFRKIKEIIIELLRKKDRILEFLREEHNKSGIKKIFVSIRRVLKHIAPKKIQGVVHFGTGDPCSTGQTLGAIAACYGFYGDKISIIPNFEEEVLDGELFLKGRIRLVTLLIIAIKLILDDNFKRLIKNAKQLKEEL